MQGGAGVDLRCTVRAVRGGGYGDRDEKNLACVALLVQHTDARALRTRICEPLLGSVVNQVVVNGESECADLLLMVFLSPHAIDANIAA